MSQLPPHIQAIIDAQARGTAAPAAPAQAVVAAAPAPPPFDPNVIPDINSIPDQSGRGPKYLPWDEIYDLGCTLHQIRHRPPTDRSGPRFEAIFTVDTVAAGSTIMPGTERARAWFYNPYAYGKDKDASERNLRDFKAFVAACMGQATTKDFDSNAAASQLIALSVQVPSLGIRIRLLNQADGVSKTTGKTFYAASAQLA
jgi:hypothetical protein